MDRREQLREQYEDALFALLMDEVAEMEGEKALEENRRLQEDPAAAVPEEVDRRCMGTIRGYFRKMKLRAARRFAVKNLGRAVMVLGMLSTLFMGVFAMSEKVRIRTMNLVVETFGESTDFVFKEEQIANEAPRISLGWVPDGFVLVDEGADDTGSWCEYDFEEKFIHAMYIVGDGSIMSIDTEEVKPTSIKIGGINATLVCKDGNLQILWSIPDEPTFIYLTADGISEENFIHVANEVHY